MPGDPASPPSQPNRTRRTCSEDRRAQRTAERPVVRGTEATLALDWAEHGVGILCDFPPLRSARLSFIYLISFTGAFLFSPPPALWNEEANGLSGADLRDAGRNLHG